MKKLLIITLLFTCLFVNAQDKSTTKEITTTSTLKFSFDTQEDLKKFNWNDIKEYASENNPEEIIHLEFVLNFAKNKNDTKTNAQFSAEGKSKNIDDLIEMSQKMLKISSKI